MQTMQYADQKLVAQQIWCNNISSSTQHLPFFVILMINADNSPRNAQGACGYEQEAPISSVAYLLNCYFSSQDQKQNLVEAESLILPHYFHVY